MFLTKSEYRTLIPAISDCFERCFGKRLPQRYFEWRYLENPTGELIANILLDESRQRVLANYSVSPVAMVTAEGTTMRTALSMTTMVDRSLQGQGVFTRLCAETMELLADSGYELLWGFPNEKSYGGLIRKAGWKHLRAFSQLRIPVRTAAQSPAECHRDDEFTLNYEPLENTLPFLHVQKRRDYLRWRYRDNPICEYGNLVIQIDGEVCAMCVFKKYANTLDLVDLCVPDSGSLSLLLSAVHQEASHQRVEYLNLWWPEHHPLFEALLSEKFVPTEPLTRFGARKFSSANTQELLDYHNWFLQMGDSDVY